MRRQFSCENVRRAWQQAATGNQAHKLGQSGEGLAHFFLFANFLSEGEAAFGLAANHAALRGDGELEAQMRALQADFLVQLGEGEKARDLLETAIRTGKGVGVPLGARHRTPTPSFARVPGLRPPTRW